MLKNGHLSSGKQPIHTYHTCAFDSLYTMVAALYADFGEVRSQIDQIKSDCKFSEMISAMFDSESKIAIKNNSLLRRRNLVLKSIFEGTLRVTELDSGLTTIDCAANINYIIPKALPTKLYSYLRKRQCDDCDYAKVSERCFVDINIALFEQKSIRDLNECLLHELMTESPSICTACNSSTRFTQLKFSTFIIIDLHLAHHIREISLHEIPRTLKIYGVLFDLFGCIEFIGDETVSDIEYVGHYVSHILRRNQWERYDDLKSGITKSSIYSKIKGQILFYVKKSE